ncbi:MAG: hypothetical protein ABJI59_24030 [Nisaea sp.]
MVKLVVAERAADEVIAAVSRLVALTLRQAISMPRLWMWEAGNG